MGTFVVVITPTSVLTGGTLALDNLTLRSTTHATKGKILFGTSGYDEVNNRMGFGTVTPASKLEVSGDIRLSGVGGVNNTLQFGTNYGAAAINLYGTSWGWGLNGGEMQFFGTGVGADHISFNTGGALQPAGTNEVMRIVLGTGAIGMGTSGPTARLHLAAGVAAAAGAPLKLTTGALLTAPEVGAEEFLTDDRYYTGADGVRRRYAVNSQVIRLRGFTVATLPAGVQGDTAFVTDALTPTYLATVASGGAVVTAVFYNGAAWVCT